MSGFGSIIAFEIDGGEAAAYRVLNALSVIDISNNLGDSKSLACHPYTTTHSSLNDDELAELGITTSHLRLSVGLESTNDLMNDIESLLESNNPDAESYSSTESSDKKRLTELNISDSVVMGDINIGASESDISENTKLLIENQSLK